MAVAGSGQSARRAVDTLTVIRSGERAADSGRPTDGGRRTAAGEGAAAGAGWTLRYKWRLRSDRKGGRLAGGAGLGESAATEQARWVGRAGGFSRCRSSWTLLMMLRLEDVWQKLEPGRTEEDGRQCGHREIKDDQDREGRSAGKRRRSSAGRQPDRAGRPVGPSPVP